MPDAKTTNGNGNGAQQVEVFATKGPLAGRRVVLPGDQVDAATAEGGWAVKIEPGAQLLADPGAAYDTSWVIPGYSASDLEPFAKTAEGKAEKPTEPAKATEKPAAEPAGSSSASKTSSSQPAAPSATEPDAASPNGGASAPSGSKTTTTKTSSK